MRSLSIGFKNLIDLVFRVSLTKDHQYVYQQDTRKKPLIEQVTFMAICVNFFRPCFLSGRDHDRFTFA